MIPGQAQQFFEAAAAQAGGSDFKVDRSLRFSTDDGAYLNRAPSAAGDKAIWTLSFWIKICNLTANKQIFTVYSDSSNDSVIRINGNNYLEIYNYRSGSYQTQYISNAQFRDTSSWYHFVISCNDSTSLNAWVNGQAITSWSSSSGPNGVNWLFNSTNTHQIGRYNTNALNDFYLAEVNWIEGQALTSTDFGAFDASTGVWNPIEYTAGFGEGLTTSEATGALPIFNTTDSFGAVKGSGTRTDSSSSNIELAVAMDGTNGGTTFTDQHATIKGSGSAVSLTANGDVQTVTSVSKFYGSSAFFDGTGDSLSFSNIDLQRSNFTYEAWVYATDTTKLLPTVIFTAGFSTGVLHSFGLANSSAAMNAVFGASTRPSSGNYWFQAPAITANKWTHIAWERDGTIISIYVNGVIQTLDTSNGGNGGRDEVTNVSYIGTNASNEDFSGYIQDARIYSTDRYNSNSFTVVGISNSFQLNFSDNSSDAALGTDSSGKGNTWTVNNLQAADGSAVTVGAANGGLPIRNTSGDQGGTPVSGFRSDSFADDLFLALPLNTNTSDVSNSINSGSTTKTTTNQSTATSSTQARFYGASSYWNANTDGILVAESGSELVVGTGDFTIELWFYDDSNHSGGGSGRCYLFDNRIGGSVVGDPPTITGYVDGSSDIKYGSSGGGTITSSQGTDGVNNKWFHFAAVRNSGTTTLYINGTSVGSHSDTTNYTNNGFGIGRATDGGYGWAGYIQDFRVYKTAKYTSDFNIPAEANPTLGAGCDSLIDTPTNFEADSGNNVGNYCVWNPLSSNGGVTIRNGNLDTVNTGSAYDNPRATFGMSSGQWYWEVLITSFAGGFHVGLALPNAANSSYLGATTGTWAYGDSGQKYDQGTSSSYGSSFASVGKVISCAFDADAGTVVFYNDGVSQGTAFTGLTDGPYLPAVYARVNSTGGSWNFGQRPYTYAPPSGYKALCTTNLADSAVTNPSTAFDVDTWSGDGTDPRSRTLSFGPDLVWIKTINQSNWHYLTDIVRGAPKKLYTNSTNAEDTAPIYGQIDSFNSNGFTLGGGTDPSNPLSDSNQIGTNYVAWAWDAGGSSVTNEDGSITSQVSANQTTGFSILTLTFPTYSGTSTVGHGLNAAPHWWIMKDRDSADGWYTGHISSGANKYLRLETTDAENISTTLWDNTLPSSSVIYNNGTSMTGAGDYVMYAWAPVEGYSAFGSYEGNGNASGPFVYTGFKPRWIMIKNVDNFGSGYDWFIFDTARDTLNVAENILQANLSSAETDSDSIDLLSNGFKIRTTANGLNLNAHTHIYCAFAEHPFKISRAR
jgi:hypothetical protein